MSESWRPIVAIRAKTKIGAIGSLQHLEQQLNPLSGISKALSLSHELSPFDSLRNSLSLSSQLNPLSGISNSLLLSPELGPFKGLRNSLSLSFDSVLTDIWHDVRRVPAYVPARHLGSGPFSEDAKDTEQDDTDPLMIIRISDLHPGSSKVLWNGAIPWGLLPCR